MTNIAIIGAGFIGRAWAIAHARAGNKVHFWDQDPAATPAAMRVVSELLPDLEANDLLNGQDRQTILDRIVPASTLEEALSKATFIHENTPERLDIKKEVFQKLDAAALPEAIIASSTSALLPSAFTADLPGRARCLVAHPINPPYVIPAVEIVPAPWTTRAAVDTAVQVLENIGNRPIVMKREIDGFIMNRLQGALMEEAFRLVADGYASVEDIDIGMREGIGLRWSFVGPFETCDLNAPGGIRDYVQRYQDLFVQMSPSMMRRVDWAGPVLDEIERERRALLPAEELTERQNWRDRRLLALVSSKRIAERDYGV